jgi:rubrerythrin
MYEVILKEMNTRGEESMTDKWDDLLQKQRSYEEKNVDELTPLVEQASNSVLKMFLGQIMLDSKKHALILQAIQDLRAGQIIWHIDKQQMKEQLTYHFETEKRMLESLQTISAQMSDEKSAPLLKDILEDERRHHQILMLLIDTIDNLDVNQDRWLELYEKFQQEDFGRT